MDDSNSRPHVKHNIMQGVWSLRPASHHAPRLGWRCSGGTYIPSSTSSSISSIPFTPPSSRRPFSCGPWDQTKKRFTDFKFNYKFMDNNNSKLNLGPIQGGGGSSSSSPSLSQSLQQGRARFISSLPSFKNIKLKRQTTFDSEALEKELDVLKQRLSQEVFKFNKWRNQYRLRFIVGGVLLGSFLISGSSYLYISNHPESIDKIIAILAKTEFNNAKTYEDRKKIFFSIPEPDVPTSSFAELILEKINSSYNQLGNESSSASNVGDAAPPVASGDEDVSTNVAIVEWGRMVGKAFSQLESSHLISVKAELRSALANEVMNSTLSLKKKLSELRTLINPSIERDVLVESMINDYLKEHKWVKASILEANYIHKQSSSSRDVGTILLQTAITYFPGGINNLLLMLNGEKSVEDVSGLLVKGENIEAEELQQRLKTVNEALTQIKKRYQALSPKIQQYVLQQSITNTITILPELGKTAAPHIMKPYDLYVRAVEQDLLGPLRRDARIGEEILTQVKMVFLALPGDIQARILLTAIQHPDSKGEVTPLGQARVVRDLLSAGGVVAVKLAQVICEDPRVPDTYRELLGSLRDTNEPMSLPELWHVLPPTVRANITHLGHCLGTGSVKQVNRALLKSNPTNNKAIEVGVAVLRCRVEDEALASLGALAASEELEPVATRLGRLVYGEFNLFEEGEALEEFALTSIGRHRLFHVVKVVHHSPKCIIEAIAEGPTVAKVLRDVNKDTPRTKSLSQTLDTLTEFHRTILKAFIEDGLIHSDIHLGNVVEERHSTTGDVTFAMFDVGQFEHIGPADTTALLWAMSWISTPERRKMLKNVALKHLLATSQLKDTTVPADKVKEEMEKRIFAAFQEALLPFPDGSMPDKKTAWILFLRNSERNGVALPKGAFAVAKMMDSVISQQLSYGLPSVLDEAVEGFLTKHMSWFELADVLQRKVLS